MAEFFNTAEGGTPGVAVTTANSGGASGTAFNEIRKSSTPTIEFASTSFNGSVSYHLNCPAGTAGALRWNFGAGVTEISTSFYVQVTAQNGIWVFHSLFNTSFQAVAVLAFDADRRIVLQNSGVGIGTTSPPTTFGAWYRARVQANTSGLLAVQIFEGNSTTEFWSASTSSSTVTSLSYARNGCETAGVATDHYIDDWRLITGTTDPIELPPTGPAWSVWNGTAEQSLTLDGLWNGTTIEPLTLDTVTDVEVPAFVMDETEPSAANTGLAVTGLDVGDLTIHTGNITATNGQTIENLLLRGRISIPSGVSNVTVQNIMPVSCTPQGTYIGEAIINSAGTNVVIRNVKITPVDPTLGNQDNSVWYTVGIKLTGGSALVERCEISECMDAFYVTGGSHEIRGNYVHDFNFRTDMEAGPDTTSHNDGFQLMGGTNHNIHGNSADMRYSTTVGMSETVNPDPEAEQIYPDCHGVLIQSSSNKMTGVVVTKNWFHYGAICVHAEGKAPHVDNVAEVSENRFTPNQALEFGIYQQMMRGSTWTLNGTETNVYSDHSDTPVEWRGEPIKAPTNGGTRWAYNQSAHTP